MDWEKLWQDIKTFFTTNVWNIVAFFATLFVGIVVIKIIMTLLRKSFGRTRMEKITQQFILTIIKFLLWFVLVLALIGIMGIELSGIITAFSAMLLAVGMALENNIANLANGIVIVGSQMFKKGDYIIVDDVEGSIVDINFLFTTLHTSDNKRVTLPNSTIVNSAVINTGANDTRRVDFAFSTAHEVDVELVKKIVVDCMNSNGKVYNNQEHTPFCRLASINATCIDFKANCWCDGEDYWDVYYYVTETVYNQLKRNGIRLPYAHMEVRQPQSGTLPYDDKPLPPRVEKVREQKKTEFEKIVDEVEHRRKASKQRKQEAKKRRQEAKLQKKASKKSSN